MTDPRIHRDPRIRLEIEHASGDVEVVYAQRGERLRDVLLRRSLSPYGKLTQRANCGGRGFCATCGVWLNPAPAPEHWHDALAERYGYPRLACQIRVERPMRVQLLEGKLLWGKVWPDRQPATVHSEDDD